MKMKKLLSVLAVAFMLFYIGYQVTANLTEQIETIDALMVEVEDKETCEGFFVRAVQPVYGSADKSYEFLAENGEKVSSGTRLAVCFDSADAAEAFRQARSLETDIANTRAAYREIKADDGGLTLDEAIFRDMESLSGLLHSGEVWNSDSAYSGLTQAIVAREYPRESLGELEQRIAAMESELQALNAAAAGGQVVASDRSGYFIKATECSPALCTVEEMRQLTPDRLRNLCEDGRNAEKQEGVVGYIMETFEWYYVCAMPEEAARAIDGRTAIDLCFPYILSENISAKIDDVTYFENEDAVVVFRCGFIDDDFLRGAVETCDVVKQSYSGIRIPREALHQNEAGEWGVYCLNGAMLQFKTIEWTYKGDTYYIARPAASAGKGLYLYDKIVIRGKGLEAGMVIE